VSAGVRSLDGRPDGHKGRVRQWLRQDRVRSPRRPGGDTGPGTDHAHLIWTRPWPARGAVPDSVSGRALHELSCPWACRKAHPLAALVAGGRRRPDTCRRREAAADTSMTTCAGHPTVRTPVAPKQRTVNPPLAPLLLAPTCTKFVCRSGPAAVAMRDAGRRGYV
jgi:hypothetical protein